MPVVWLELEELEAIVKCLATTFEEWKMRPWAPDCNLGLMKLISVQLAERNKKWAKDTVEALQTG